MRVALPRKCVGMGVSIRISATGLNAVRTHLLSHCILQLDRVHDLLLRPHQIGCNTGRDGARLHLVRVAVCRHPSHDRQRVPSWKYQQVVSAQVGDYWSEHTRPTAVPGEVHEKVLEDAVVGGRKRLQDRPHCRQLPGLVVKVWPFTPLKNDIDGQRCVHGQSVPPPLRDVLVEVMSAS